MLLSYLVQESSSESEASYELLIGFSLWGKDYQGFFSPGRYKDSNHDRGYDLLSMVLNNNEEIIGIQRPLPTVQPPQKRNQEVKKFFSKVRPHKYLVTLIRRICQQKENPLRLCLWA